MKKYKMLIPVFIFLLLTVLSFRKVLFTPGIIGHTWDWGMPHFSEQYMDKLKSHFFIWDDNASGGRYLPLRYELLLWIIILPFKYLGAQLASKIILMVFIFISGVTMYILARYCRLNNFWAGLAGVFYMFSPVAYSRVVAGHLPVLLGYSILPLFAKFLHLIVDAIGSKKKVFFEYIYFLSVLSALLMTSPITLIVIFILTGTFLVWHFILGVNSWRLIKISCLVIMLVMAINSFWLLSGVYDYYMTKNIGHGMGLSLSAGEKVTKQKELPLRKQYLQSVSQPLFNSIRIYSRIGMDTEYVWPISDKWKIPWIIISFLNCFLFFSILFRKNRNMLRILGPYIIMAILAILLVSGYRTFLGGIIFSVLARFVPIVYMDLVHISRMFILLCLCYTIGIFYFLSKLEGFIRKRWILRSTGVLGVVIFILPFINGNITEPIFKMLTQPHSLKINDINREDSDVYTFFKNNADDFRLTYLPPVMMSWPGNTDLSYEWNVLSDLSPKPEFLGLPEATHLSYDIVQNLYSVNSSPYLGRLLGLANVKYIIYPHYDFFVSYRDFIPEYNSSVVVEGYKDYKPIVDSNIEKQENLIKLDIDFNTVIILENKWFLPHIYVSGNESLVFSKKGGFIPLSYTDCFNGLPAAIFIRNKDELEKFKKKTLCENNKTFIALTKDEDAIDFYVPTDGKYKILAKINPRYIFKNVEMDRYDLNISLPEEWARWTVIPNMVTYDCKLEDGKDLVIACDFDGKSEEDEYVLLNRTGLRIDIKKYPWVELDYKVENKEIQTIEMVAGLDFDEDGIVDGHIKMGYPSSPSEVFDKFAVNIYNKAYMLFPNKRHYDLVELELYPHKLWETDCSKLYGGSYLFYIRNISFTNYRQKMFVKMNNPAVYNKWDAMDECVKDWYITKRRMNARAERVGKGVIFKKENEILEIAKEIEEPLNLSQWEYFELEYIAQPLLVKKIKVVLDLEDREDVYITDLEVRGSLRRIDINIYDVLRNSYPELKDFNLKKIKFWVMGKGCDEDVEDTFLIHKMQIYSLEIPADIVLKKQIISIDGNPLWYRPKFNKSNSTEDIFWQDKVRLSMGWHQMKYFRIFDENFNLDWVVLSSSEGERDVMTLPSTEFIKVNPTKYIVDIKDAKDSFWLVFLENFHEGWMAYIKPKIKNKKSKIKWWENSAIWTWGKTRGMKKLDVHFEVNGYANGWWLDPSKIRDPKSKIQDDEDLEVIIVFKPQRYYELGLIISGLIVFGGFGFVLWRWFKNRK